MYATGVIEEAIENGGIVYDVGTTSCLNITSSSFSVGHTFESVLCVLCMCVCSVCVCVYLHVMYVCCAVCLCVCVCAVCVFVCGYYIVLL